MNLHHGKIALQVVLLCLFWLITEAFSITHGWPVPGSVIGLLVLLALLELRVIKISWVQHGGNFLLGHLMLFFVPAMLGLVSHPELVSALGLKLLAAVLLGTLMVMGATALVVDRACHIIAKREARRKEHP